MTQMSRRGLTVSEKEQLWNLWRRGKSLSSIGIVLGKHAGSIHGVVSLCGGIAPQPRKRSRLSLSMFEREEVSRGLASKRSIRQIAVVIGRNPSTVSREIYRNGGASRYRAMVSDSAAWKRARRPKICLLAINCKLRKVVSEKLGKEWSPEQIAGWLKRIYPNDKGMRVSHETIYKTLFIQTRGVLKKELTRRLRSKRMMRHSKNASSGGQPRGQIVDGVSIRERPAEVEDRAVPGHWEGDLITGSNNSHVATMVERTSRYTMLIKVMGKDTDSVVSALTREVKKLPGQLRRSLTWDRGMEMARHKKFTIDTNVKVYFCDPRSPWQRGTNENTNRLIRQYLPAGLDLSTFSQAELNKIAIRLNQRPRKTLGFETPTERFILSVATTG